MKDNRPVNLSLRHIAFPASAIASITHRISGVVIFVGTAPLVYGFYHALASAAGFEKIRALLAQTPVQLLLFAVLLSWVYHTLAGIRHLLMDLGWGESLRGGRLGAWLVFAGTAALAAPLAAFLGLL